MGKKVVKVFLDSNVILSGLLSERGAPRILLDLLNLKLPFLEASTGRYNLIEIERNLKNRMPSVWSVYERYLPQLNLTIIPLPQSEELREFSGKIADKDIPVLVSAIQGKVDLLVTGDKKHFEKLKGIEKYHLRIVSPSELVDSILPEILKEYEGKSE
ncbi:MAG: PIN domain-containing protein [Thermodesulfobacteriota bacterium]|nr:PIN domain-containing protein [Thermodesulfobacteriota bacterium]